MRWYLVLLSLVLSTVLFGQQYNFTQYSIEQGLPRSGVYSLMEDHNGFIWAAIEDGGVCILDGQKITTIDKINGLPTNDIRFLFEDDENVIWMGTQGSGVIKYNGKKFISYKYVNGLSNDIVRTIAQDKDGKMWFGTYGGGVSILDPKTELFDLLNNENNLPDNNVNALLYDSKNCMWIGCDRGLVRYQDGKFTTLTTENGLPHNKILSLFEDSKGQLWIGTQKGLVLYNKDKIIKTYTTLDGLAHNRIQTIGADIKNHIWIGTREGLNVIENNHVKLFTEANGLCNSQIRSVICDKSGNVWIGTYFGGINKYCLDAFSHFRTQEGLLNNQILSVGEDATENILIGTYNGLNTLSINQSEELTKTESFTDNNGLSSNVVLTIFNDSKGCTWLGTENGLTILDHDKLQYINSNDSLVNDQVNCIIQTSENDFWVGTEEGLSHIIFEQDNRRNYTCSNFTWENGLLGHTITTLCHDKYGNIWIGYRQGGLSLIKDGKIELLQLPKSLHNVISIKEDSYGDIWIATVSNGVYRIKNNNHLLGKVLFNKVIPSTSIPSGVINSLTFDKEDNLWIGTIKGIVKIKLDNKRAVSSTKFYSKDEGFSGIETTRNASILDSKGNLWFGTVHGVTRYDPEYDLPNIAPPQVTITGVKLFFKEVDWDVSEFSDTALTRFNIPQNLILPYNLNHLTFNFIGINNRIPSKIRYKWILEGVDKKITNIREENKATYTNLSSGKYTFKVWAQNSDGVWNKKPATFSFIITPPFWLTWWFIVLAVLFSFGIFQMISGIRTRRLKAAKLKLEHLVHTRTLELREEKEQVEKKNGEIQNQKNQIEKQHSRLEKAFEELDEKNTAITDSINYAKRIQTAIMKPANESGSKLNERMFIFYHPKDIVSGDFFWFNEFDGKSFATASDCTGHGVPGAFMSMIGITYLNEIVEKKGIYSPSAILDELRNSVINALYVEGEEHNDGMDISFSTIYWKERRLEWSGAQNPLFLYRKGELTVFKGDKMPVGMHDNANIPFINHSIDFEENDMIYMFSDGFPDQFGGEKGKKLMTKNFKDILSSICNLPLNDQRNALEKQFKDWQGPHEQVDDVLVIGIRL